MRFRGWMLGACLLVAPALAAAHGLSPEDLAANRDAAFAEADADQSGTLTLEEFEAFSDILRQRMQARQFDRLDVNDDGAVSAEELAAFRPPRPRGGRLPFVR